MDCKEFERLIPDFIDQKMDYEVLKKFSEHIYACENCKEELTIQFLVFEGMQRLEEGDAFDLRKELNLRLSEMQRKMQLHERMKKLTFGLETFTVIALLGFVIWMMLG